MLLEFKQAVHLKDIHGKGKDYARGVHEVSQAVFDHPHSKQVLHKLAKAGLILEPKPEVSPATFYDRQKKLADRLAALERSPVQAPASNLAPEPAATTPNSSEEGEAVNPPAESSSEPADGEDEADESSEDQEELPLSKSQQKKLKKQQKG